MKLKLSTKLLTGFLAVALIGSFVGGFGIYQLTNLNNGINFLHQSALVPVTYLVHMKSNFVEQRLDITKAGMAKSSEEAAAYDRAFQELAAKNKDYNERFRASLVSADDLRVYDDYERSANEYVKGGSHILSLLAAGKVGEAQAMILDASDAGVPALGRLHQANMDRLVATMEKHATDETDKLEASGAFSIVIMVVLSVVGFGVSIILGIWLGLIQISRPLMRLSETLQSGSLQINSASTQLSASSQEIANGATEQASSVQETSASMEELSSMVKQNLANSRETSLLASRASEAAETGQHDMTRMVDAMRQIAESSEEVAKVINLIDSISFKTNILALNAAVEAARAGEAGLGFAVVADEVKNLANRSADAAKDTAEMIKNSIKKINEGNAIADRLAEGFKNILSNSRKVAEMSHEVEEASTQQETGISQVTKAIIQFDEVVQANASASEETASAAEELTGQAASLMNLVRDLSTMVNGSSMVANSAQAVSAPPPYYNNVYSRPSTPQSRQPINRRPVEATNNRGQVREISPEKLIPFENDEDLGNQ